MTYLTAAQHADEAARLGDVGTRMYNDGEKDRGIECLGLAIHELGGAIADLARALHSDN